MISNKSILIVLMLAFSVRLVAIRVSGTFTKDEGSDAIHYRSIGLNLAQGNGYSADQTPPFTPDAVREPVYPVFLAVCFKIMGYSVLRVQIVQAAIDTFSVYLIYLLTLHALQDFPRIRQAGALIAASLYAVLPCAIRNAVVLVREPLFIFLLLVSVWLLRRFGWRTATALGCGALLGIDTLCRANLQLVPFVLLPILIYQSGRRAGAWRLAAMFLGANMLIVLPWYVRNYVTFGAIGLSPTLGINLFQRTWSFDLEGNKEPELRALVKRAMVLPDGSGPDELYTLTVGYRTKGLLDQNLPAWEVDHRFREVAVENIFRHPWEYIGTSIVEMGKWWYVTDNYSRIVHGYASGFFANLRDRQWLPLLFLVSGYLFSSALLFFMAYGAIRWWDRVAVEMVVVAYFAVTTALVQICYLSRYWVVAAPFVSVAVGVASAHLLGAVLKRRSITPAPAAVPNY